MAKKKVKRPTTKKIKFKSWSELLSKAFQAYKKNSFILIPALIPIIFSVFIETFTEISSLFYTLLLFLIVVGIYIKAGMLGIVKESLKLKSSLKTFFKTANKKYISLLVADLIVAGIIFLFIFSLGIPLLANLYYNMNGILIFLSGIILAVIVLICLHLSFTSYAVILSDLKAIQGIKESIMFVKKNFLKVILFYVIVFLLMIPIISAISLIKLYSSLEVSIFLSNIIIWLITPYFMFLQGYFYLSKK